MRITISSIAIFALKWIVAGLAFAGVLLLVRPDLRSQRPMPTATKQPLHVAETPKAPAIPSQPPSIVPTPITSYADAVAKTAPAVVSIYTTRVVTERARVTNPWQLPPIRQRVEGGLGSGVIVDAQGHVVTNHHVIAKADKIRLQLADGRIADATVVGKDPDTDLALVKINLRNLPVMPMGRSDSLRAGDVALAIGSPYGLSQTVTHGIVSATGRNDLGLFIFENFIQTDAAINVGNSGGALINAQGELIGINTAMLGQETGGEGIGVAIPVDLVRGVVAQLIKHGHVSRGWFGVNPQPLSQQRATSLGLGNASGFEIADVDLDSPAAKAGLRSGDVITALNGRAVRDEREAMNRVAAAKPGSTMRVLGRNDQGPIDTQVTIGERK